MKGEVARRAARGADGVMESDEATSSGVAADQRMADAGDSGARSESGRGEHNHSETR